MEVAIDKFGRIVIPKAVRDLLGLQAGSELALEVMDREGGQKEIALRPIGAEPELIRKGGGLVFHAGHMPATGRLDAAASVREARRQRSGEVSPTGS